MRRLLGLLGLLAVVSLVLGVPFAARPAFAAATIVVVNNDGAGEGFNDPTPFTPVGGNPAVTLGQARLNAFTYAANLWGTCITSNVTIRVRAQMDPQTCTPTSATLGSAAAETVHRDFANAPIANTWYPQALANSYAGVDLDPATNDIRATFNSNINGSAGCLGGGSWYYGYDGNPGPNQWDFVTVVLHEIGHGLGFATFVDLTTGAKFMGRDDVYMRFLEQAGATPSTYPAMTDAQRITASTSDPDLRWTGPNATAQHPNVPITAGLNGGFLRNHAPSPQVPGSSVSHWSTALSPSELMEPSYTGPDHRMSLALYLLQDIGWVLDGSTPSITCPAPLVVECTTDCGTPASNPAIVAFLAGASSTGGCGEVEITNDAPSFFSCGITPVTFTARDGANAEDQCTVNVQVVDTTDPIITCPANIQIECTSAGGTPKTDPQLAPFFAGVSATDVCDASPAITDDAPAFFPLGLTTVTFTATDDTGNDATCSRTVEVVDTTAPTIAVDLSRYDLWPPNHRLSPITAEVTVTDICDPNPTFVLTSITSSEPENGLGDGDTAPDIVGAAYGTADVSFHLRSERGGPGVGRTYTILYTASDGSGNTSESTVYVNVAHDQSAVVTTLAGFEGGTGGVDPDAQWLAVALPTILAKPVAMDETLGDVVVRTQDGVDRADEAEAGGIVLLDAARILPGMALIGNVRGVVAPDRATRADVSGDGLDDLVLFYPAAAVRDLIAASTPEEDGAVGLHFRTRDGAALLAPDIQALSAATGTFDATQLSAAARAVRASGDDRAAAGAVILGAAGEAQRPIQPEVAGAVADGEAWLGLVRPNPFRGEALLEFGLPREGDVRIEVVDVRGARRRILAEGVRPAGRHVVSWDGRDEQGRTLPPGIYWVRMTLEQETWTRRMVLVL